MSLPDHLLDPPDRPDEGDGAWHENGAWELAPGLTPRIFTSTDITIPGIYIMPAADYHRDPCAGISLSHTLARMTIDRSPWHAAQHHPRIGGRGNEDVPRIAHIGSVVHSLALGRGPEITVVDARDFRAKDAREAKEAAIVAHKTPVLAADYEKAVKMAHFAREAIEAALETRIADCLVECVVAARDPETGQWRRIMVDAMTRDLRRIVDLKTTEIVEPLAFGRRLMSNGYDTQDAFYRHVLDAIDPDGEGARTFTFVAQERDYPEAITLHQLDATALRIADARMARARRLWDECLLSGDWKRYPRSINVVTCSDWEIEREEGFALERAFAGDEDGGSHGRSHRSA